MSSNEDHMGGGRHAPQMHHHQTTSKHVFPYLYCTTICSENHLIASLSQVHINHQNTPTCLTEFLKTLKTKLLPITDISVSILPHFSTHSFILSKSQNTQNYFFSSLCLCIYVNYLPFGINWQNCRERRYMMWHVEQEK